MNRQLSLFEQENRAVSHVAGLTALIRASMNRVAAASPLSRQQIVDRMNSIAKTAGVRMTQGNARIISLDTLEKWLNPDSGHVPSLVAVEVFMQALDSAEPLAAWLSMHGCEVMRPEDKQYRDLGRGILEKEEVVSRVNLLKRKLQEER